MIYTSEEPHLANATPDYLANIPVSSAMKSDDPIPTGAMKVALCFSAAGIKIVKTSCAVRNLSMKRPRTIEVPPLSDVRMTSGAGKRA